MISPLIYSHKSIKPLQVSTTLSRLFGFPDLSKECTPTRLIHSILYRLCFSCNHLNNENFQSTQTFEFLNLKLQIQSL